jgi:hypothetical protein
MDDSYKQLDPASPLGQVNDMLRQEAEQRKHPAMAEVADVCTRRSHDPDPDVRKLTRAFLFLYATSRGVDLDTLVQRDRQARH